MKLPMILLYNSLSGKNAFIPDQQHSLYSETPVDLTGHDHSERNITISMKCWGSLGMSGIKILTT